MASALRGSCERNSVSIKLMYEAEKLTKPLPERYIHSCIETQKGEIIILTFIPYLLKLLDDPGVTPFDGDTPYKGIEGKLNEWELTIFTKVVQRDSTLSIAASVVSADLFEFLFDELQRVKREVTGKPLPFKMFIPVGHWTVSLGLSNPEYIGIPKNPPPEQAAPKFTKIGGDTSKCTTVSFRIRCLIKSQSSIPADIWEFTPSTTNTNEAQHHWTNTLTRIKLMSVEALESRRVVDQNDAREIENVARDRHSVQP
ncbi:hypothetical protein K438DRAFT_1777600 [Mycena galopus ATCC 62051]|nr:hypothetical protein K438DRAFT_1777600 [Mycena galopus ATCC 62051]